jgi:hypothetical protein
MGACTVKQTLPIVCPSRIAIRVEEHVTRCSHATSELKWSNLRRLISRVIEIYVKFSGRSRSQWPSSGVGLRPLACWDCGFESHRSMDVCLLWVLCFIRYRSLQRACHSSRGVLLTVVRHCVCDLETWWRRRPWPTGGIGAKTKTK